MPFKDNSFDFIFVVASVYWIPGPLLALKDFYRVLKPGKRVIIFDYTRKTLLKLPQKHYDERIEHISIWTAGELKYLFKQAGFKNVKQLLNSPVSSWKKII